MNKIFFAIIIFTIGLIAGYAFLVLAGYMAAWSVDLIIIIGTTLKDYEVFYMFPAIDGVLNLIRLILTGISVFFITGLLLSYFIKSDIDNIKQMSSLGIFIIPTLFSGLPSLYSGQYFDSLTIIAVPLLVNLLFINKISSIIKTPNKNEETNTNPRAD